MSNEWTEEVIDRDSIKLTNAGILRLINHNKALQNELSSVVYIKDCIAQRSFEEAKEAWVELTEDVQTDLWVAPSKGGIFTTKERDVIKNNFRGKS